MSIRQKSSIELMYMYAEILAELNSRKDNRLNLNPQRNGIWKTFDF